MVQDKKTQNKQNEKLLETIIKLTMLVCLSISSTLISSTAVLIGAIEQSIQLYVYSNLIVVFDIFFNSICFMLQFHFNKNIYFKICGWCHFQCYKCILEKSVSNDIRTSHDLRFRVNSDVNTGVNAGTTTPKSRTNSRSIARDPIATTAIQTSTTRKETADIIGIIDVSKPDKKRGKYNGIHTSLSINSNVSDTEKEKEKEKNIGFKNGNGNDSDVSIPNPIPETESNDKESEPMEIEIVDHDSR